MNPQGVGLVVLTGGASRRMGRDKATLDAGGVPLAARPELALRGLIDEMVLAGRPVPGLDCRVVMDDVTGAGPLAGIIAGLRALSAPVGVVVACDMPSVSTAVVALLLERVAGDPRVEAAVCAAARGGVEPLPMVVRRRAVVGLLAASREGASLRAGLAVLACAVVPEAEWRALDPGGDGFVSWNHPEDVHPLSGEAG